VRLSAGSAAGVDEGPASWARTPSASVVELVEVVDEDEAVGGARVPQERGFGCGRQPGARLRAWQQAGVWEKLHELLLAELACCLICRRRLETSLR
jgi:hypothetical protein